jgi:hypothetical protein
MAVTIAIASAPTSSSSFFLSMAIKAPLNGPRNPTGGNEIRG